MKLATYQDGSRDGQLVVVSRDLSTAHYATGIAYRLQQVMDDWNFMSPQLQDLSNALNQTGHPRARHAFPFDPARCMAPLPRAYQWVSGGDFAHDDAPKSRSSGPNGQQAASAESGQTVPQLQQGASDGFSGAQDPIGVPNEAATAAWGVDFNAALAVVTGDVPMGASPAQGVDGVRLLMLVNEVSLRHVMAEEAARGSGTVQGKPGAAFGPVAVTPDELAVNGDSAWQNGHVHLVVQSTWNGRKVGMLDAGAEMRFGFGELIAHVCRTRNLWAGSVIGSGTVRNKDVSRGYSCIFEKRALDVLQSVQPVTPYMALGDSIRIEVKGKDGASVFGAISQTVTLAASSR